MNPIVVAFDEHEHATAALRWAGELADLTGEPLEVVSVYEPTFAEIAPDWYRDLIDTRHEKLVAVLAEIGHPEASTLVLTSERPLDAVADHLRHRSASMCVLGAHGDYGPGTLGGTPAARLLHHVKVPVAAIRPGYEPLSSGTIVVGVDGSDANLVALREAERLARAADAKLQAVFAYPAWDNAYSHPQPAFETAGDWHPHSQGVRGEVNRVLSVPIELEMVEGQPAEALMLRAATDNASAIVVGTRGSGGFLHLRVGQVPSQLLAHATTPVIVVPHP